MTTTFLIDIEKLRVGMFIQLGLGWVNHPFPTGSFRLSSLEQIHTLRQLGLKQVRYVPAKSAPVPLPAGSGEPADALRGEMLQEVPESMEPAVAELWQTQAALLQRCGERYQGAVECYGQVAAEVLSAPRQAAEPVRTLVDACIAELPANGDCAVYLLAQMSGQRQAQHCANTMVLALLLARALGMPAAQLHAVGVAALLHDVGKVMLPAYVGEPGGRLGDAELRSYQSHVGLSVELCQRMGWGAEVIQAVAQHHEMADGSGFPLRLQGPSLAREGQIIALVNAYDRLCNPLHGAASFTPHEALSQLYARQRPCFDPAVLGAFIRMMGIYPPGSLVQLTDGRYAKVMVSAASTHPLRPGVQVFDPQVPRAQAPILDLSAVSGLGVSRSLKPLQLARDASEYLLPPQQISYFFAHALREPCIEDAA